MEIRIYCKFFDVRMFGNSVYRKAVELNENFEKLFEDVGKLEFIVNS